MIITHKLQPMDLAARSAPQRVDAVQDDKYSRNLEIPLIANGAPLVFPDGTTAVIRFRKSDGTGGNYDTMPDGSAAYIISGNKLTVALAPQVCTAPGAVLLAVGLVYGDAEINTFCINITVHPNPGIDVVSGDYTNMRSYVKSTGWEPNVYLGTDAGGNIIPVIGGGAPSFSLDATLTSKIKAAQSKAVGDAIKELDAGKQGKLTAGENIDITGNVISSAWFSRPNLLHNWYFADPVNQRGKSTYTDAGYTIDRWTLDLWNAVSPSLTRANGCITLSNNTPEGVGCSCNIKYIVDKPARFAGQTVTFAVLLGNVSIGSGAVCIAVSANGSSGSDTRFYAENANSVVSKTITLPSDLTSLSVYVGEHGSKGGRGPFSIQIKAAKLEIGNKQTLAHQENGAWVLNEIHESDEQLAVCRKYYQKRSIVLPVNSAGFGWYTFPIEMRSTPSVVVTIESDVVPQYVHPHGFAVDGLPANQVLNATYVASADL